MVNSIERLLILKAKWKKNCSMIADCIESLLKTVTFTAVNHVRRNRVATGKILNIFSISRRFKISAMFQT